MPSRRHFLASLAALGAAHPLSSQPPSEGPVRPPPARRERLRAAVLAPPAVPSIESLQGKIKITDLKITPVSAGAHTPYVFVRVLTDAGVTE